ncbi:hypothetical protein R3P38DRAFT_2770121 [Favolaschia claudopus]|uniref:Uncharacterized protein n=1 Tax=Favolaschia claudopus TaxID=2862362 RepID=A0AAW0CMW4_9AGAR
MQRSRPPAWALVVSQALDFGGSVISDRCSERLNIHKNLEHWDYTPASEKSHKIVGHGGGIYNQHLLKLWHGNKLRNFGTLEFDFGPVCASLSRSPQDPSIHLAPKIAKQGDHEFELSYPNIKAETRYKTMNSPVTPASTAATVKGSAQKTHWGIYLKHYVFERQAIIHEALRGMLGELDVRCFDQLRWRTVLLLISVLHGHSAHIRAEIVVDKRSINRSNCKLQDSERLRSTHLGSGGLTLVTISTSTAVPGILHHLVLPAMLHKRSSPPYPAAAHSPPLPITKLAHTSAYVAAALTAAPRLPLSNLKNDAADAEFEVGGESAATQRVLAVPATEGDYDGRLLSRAGRAQELIAR